MQLLAESRRGCRIPWSKLWATITHCLGAGNWAWVSAKAENTLTCWALSLTHPLVSNNVFTLAFKWHSGPLMKNLGLSIVSGALQPTNINIWLHQCLPCSGNLQQPWLCQLTMVFKRPCDQENYYYLVYVNAIADFLERLSHHLKVIQMIRQSARTQPRQCVYFEILCRWPI